MTYVNCKVVYLYIYMVEGGSLHLYENIVLLHYPGYLDTLYWDSLERREQIYYVPVLYTLYWDSLEHREQIYYVPVLYTLYWDSLEDREQGY